MNPFPTGTITFLFTDIEGSTRLWEAHPEAMRDAVARHDALLRQAVKAQGGYLFKTTGDGIAAAFAAAPAALDAALAAQQALAAEMWPEPVAPAVRMGLHTGAAELRDGDYFGPSLSRCARLMTAGHGGQVLLSDPVQELTREALPPGATLLRLGEYRLRDLTRSETVYQLLHPTLAASFPPLRTQGEGDSPNNLPQQITSFIGREAEIATARRLLGRNRLLTLTGAGGSGKTRLSLRVAADALEEYPDGAWQVELAPLPDPAFVPQAVARSLGIREQAGQPMEQTLTDNLKEKGLLLVLDNAEHLLTACASLVAGLLRSCPNVKVLVTSREPLGIRGETTYRVPTLTLPSTEQAQAATAESLRQFEAVRLFVDRAQSVKSDFHVTNGNASALAQICYRLDGIPLAIELAAGRVRSLAVEQINEKLDSRFRLLTGGDRSALPRQQTLRALIDWSYDLLSESEKALLQRLSLFVGGWTIEAAEAVCADEALEAWEITDTLLALVDKSLVVYEQHEEKGRYRLLETVRQYARERLNETKAAEAFRRKHRDYFLGVAEEMSRKMMSAEQSTAFRVLEADHENLRAAVRFSLDDPEGTQSGLRLGASLARFWWTRGFLTEGREHLTHLLARPGADLPTRPRAYALNSAVAIGWLQGDVHLARARLEESIAISEAGGDRVGFAVALSYLGALDKEVGDYETARVRLEEGLKILRGLGNRYLIALPLTFLGSVTHILGDRDRALLLFTESLTTARSENAHWWTVQALSGLGLLAQEAQDYDRAQTLLEESLMICRELRDSRSRSFALGNLARLMCYTGDYEAANGYLRECIAVCRQLGNKPEAVRALESYAILARFQQQPERATRLWSAADTLRAQINFLHIPIDQTQHDESFGHLHASLGSAAFTAALAQGKSLRYDAAIAFALEES